MNSKSSREEEKVEQNWQGKDCGKQWDSLILAFETVLNLNLKWKEHFGIEVGSEVF